MTKSRRLLRARRQFVHLYFTRSALLWGSVGSNHRFAFHKSSQNVHPRARVYPGEYCRREIVPPAEPERKPMVIKHVFETGGKTLQELTNFPISGDLTPPAESKEQAAPAAPAAPAAQRCPIVAIGGRVIAWTDVTDGANAEEADLP
jgi:hypothetical protein